MENKRIKKKKHKIPNPTFSLWLAQSSNLTRARGQEPGAGTNCWRECELLILTETCSCTRLNVMWNPWVGKVWYEHVFGQINLLSRECAAHAHCTYQERLIYAYGLTFSQGEDTLELLSRVTHQLRDGGQPCHGNKSTDGGSPILPESPLGGPPCCLCRIWLG